MIPFAFGQFTTEWSDLCPAASDPAQANLTFRTCVENCFGAVSKRRVCEGWLYFSLLIVLRWLKNSWKGIREGVSMLEEESYALAFLSWGAVS